MPDSFHVMAKPVGPACNLDCTYCYYLEKEHLFPKGGNFRMKPDMLESYIRQYCASQSSPEIVFTWQGGEPTLLGVEYFRSIVDLEKKHAGGRVVHNAVQTNGTLLDNEWCRFFREHNFLVGLSIDGPRTLHDTYRLDKGHKPTFDRVMRGLDLPKSIRSNSTRSPSSAPATSNIRSKSMTSSANPALDTFNSSRWSSACRRPVFRASPNRRNQAGRHPR